MRRLPQTNFDEKLALIYENMNVATMETYRISNNPEALHYVSSLDGVEVDVDDDEAFERGTGIITVNKTYFPNLSKIMWDLVKKDIAKPIAGVATRDMTGKARAMPMPGEENAEDAGGGSMRGFAEDQIISAFEGDGVMDIFELDDLARKYFGGGEEFDDMSQDDMVDRIGDELGYNLEIRGDKVMLAGYRD